MAEVRHHLLPPPLLVLLSEQLLLLLQVVLLLNVGRRGGGLERRGSLFGMERRRGCRSIIGPHRRCGPTRLSGGCSTSVVALDHRL
jgi:hypothetical protein